MPEQLDKLNLAGIIHDLNNVFETLFEASEVLRGDPKHQKLAAAMERSLKHGARIVKSLEEKGGLTDVDRLLEQSQAFLSDYLLSTRGPEITFAMTVPPALQIRGPRGAWERVFLNLFLNASRMMPTGGTIHVSAANGEDGITFLVADTGPGIPAKVLPQLFEAGFTTTPKHKGLGLHIVRSIVESLGGDVSARNREVEGGAEFRIHLPFESQLAIVHEPNIGAD